MRDPSQHSRGGRYLASLERSTIGGRWVRDQGVAFNGFELGRVSVPPSCARGWVITLSPPPWGRATLDPPLEPPPQSQHIGQTYAILEWGNGGVYASAEVDWGMGCTVNVFGSEVRVNVFSPTVIGGLVPVGIRLQSLEAFITPGESRSPVAPTRSVYYEALAETVEGVAPIPRFAKYWTLLEENARPQATVDFTSRGGTTNEASATVSTSSANNVTSVSARSVVPPAATECKLTNNAGSVASFRMQYELAI